MSAARRASAVPPPAASARLVHCFGEGKADGSAAMKPILGGKGANLHEMTRLGVPVPPGFTIGTDVCRFSSRCAPAPWPRCRA